MQVSKWGNSLAVRLPAVLVEALDLKEGDEIEFSIAGKRDFKVARDRSKERALEQLRQMKWSFSPDFRFNREEINEHAALRSAATSGSSPRRAEALPEAPPHNAPGCSAGPD